MITYQPYKQETSALATMLADASRDPFLGDIVYARKTNKMILIMDGDTLVGFAMPRLESGFFRVGPIYVDPAHRGKGVARDFLMSFFEKRSGRAYIEPDNTASRKTFTSAGFVMTGKVYVKDSNRYLQFEKRVSKSLSW